MNKIYTYFLFLIIGIMCHISQTEAQSRFISFEKESETTKNDMPERRISEHDSHYLDVEYTLHGAFVSNKQENDTTYQFLRIKGFQMMNKIGKPALPAHKELIAVPENCEVKITILDFETLELDDYYIYPALEPARDTYGAEEPEFTIDKETYSADRYFPGELAEVSETLKFRGSSFVALEMRPVQFNPVKRKMKIYSRIVYRIEFINSLSGKPEGTAVFKPNEQLKRYVLNNKSIPNEDKNIKASDEYNDYIIITHSNYQAAADTLAKWKRQMGYSVDVVSNSYWSSGDVKNAIHSRYQEWTPKPKYFVIIGDHNDVPGEVHYDPYDSESFSTDLYYACMDGSNDYVPEMAHGRISVSSSYEAMTVIKKIVNYERNPVTDNSFYQTGLNCAQFQDNDLDNYADRRFAHTSEDIRNYMINQGYTVNRVYQTDEAANPLYWNNGYYSDGQSIPSELLKSNGFAWNGGSSDIATEINNGRFYVFHRDHGYAGGSGWAHPYFTKTNISYLANGDKLPVVFSINCHTGEFMLDECFAEKFLRQSNGGAVGVFAASYYSLSGYNDAFAMGVVDAIWSGPGLLPDFGSGGISNPYVTQHDDIVTMGDVLNHGLMRILSTWNGDPTANRYEHELFHYFGDPAMKIWTEAPTSITASHDNSLSLGSTDFDITSSSCDDGLATLYFNGKLVGKTQLSNGSGKITFLPLSDAATYAVLTISKRNHRPYIAYIDVTGNGGAPANDDPCNAMLLSVSNTCQPGIATNSGATNSSNVPEPGCGSYNGADVWFKAVIPANGNLTIGTEKASDDFADGAMAVYTGDCSYLSLIECDDDDGPGNMPKIELSGRTAGETIYIRFWAYNANASGAFYVCAYSELNQSLSVSDPNSNTTWTAGNTETITWTSNDIASDENVRIKFYNGSEWSTLVSSTPNDGAEEITVPVVSNTTSRAKIEMFLISNSAVESISSEFTVESMPAPSNDEPCNAFELTTDNVCNPVDGTIIGATSSSGVPAPGCGNYQGNDVWFKTTVPSGGELILEAQVSDENFTDGAMAVYTGSCSNLSLFACNDDGNSTTTTFMPSLELSGLTGGETIYIRFWAYNNNQSGNFQLCSYAPNEQSLSINSPVSSSVWVSGGGAQITWTSTGISENEEVKIELYDGDNWHTLEYDTPNDEEEHIVVPQISSNVDNASIKMSISQLDIEVYSEDFTIHVPSLTNDEPCNAISLSVDGACTPILATNIGATASQSLPEPGCGEYVSGDVWFEAQIPDNGQLIIEGVQTENGFGDGAMAVYSGSCSDLTLIECNDDGGSGYMPKISLSDRTPGETIFIRFWEYGGDTQGEFSVCAYSSSETITFTTPNANTNWQAGSVQNLTWNSTNISSDEELKIRFYNGSEWSTLLNSTVNDGSEDVVVPSVSGTIYDAALRIYVVSNPVIEDYSDPFTISVPSLSNDEPCDAVELTVSASCSMIEATNIGATPSSSVPDPACGSYNGNDVWFKAVVPDNGMIVFEGHSITNGISDGAMAVYSGSCSNLTFIQCDDDSGEGTMPRIEVNGRTPGETIFVRFWEYGGNEAGDLGICAYSSDAGIEITNPDENTIWTSGSYQWVEWNTTNIPSTENLCIRFYNGSEWSTLVESTENDGYESVQVPKLGYSTDYAAIRIYRISDAEIEDYTSYFSIQDIQLELYSDISISPDPISRNMAVDIHLDIFNQGTADFNGSYAALLYTTDGYYAEEIEIKENMSLSAGGYHYTNGLTFSKDMVNSQPGDYEVWIAYKPEGGSWTLLPQGNYTNQVPVTVIYNSAAPDVYEENNSPETAYNFDVNYSDNTALIKTSGSNIHVESDEDYYIMDLEAGYEYTLNARVHDSYDSGDGNSYSCDVVFYIWNGSEWSEYIDTSAEELVFEGPKTICFMVQPYSEGSTGTYSLDIALSRTIYGDMYEVNDAENSAYHFNLDYQNNKATVHTSGANFHSNTDLDYYKIELATGDNYLIASRVHDSYDSGDEQNYSCDVKYYIKTGGEWSSEHDTQAGDFTVTGGGTVYFYVEPYYEGEMGSYALEFSVEKLSASDPYEENNSMATAYLFSPSFSNDQTAIKTSNANFHNNSDLDYYKVELPADYNYTVNSRIHDSYNSNDGNTYTCDVKYSYQNQNLWSDVFDTQADDFEVINGGTVYFMVQPYYEGEMGDYSLEVNISRSGSSAPFIEISQPAGSSDWSLGSEYTIEWSDNIDGGVIIELYKGGSFVETISSFTESDGSFKWEIPSDLATGDGYSILITSSDDGSLYAESAYFSLEYVGTGLFSDDNEWRYRIYPNPARDILYIEVQTAETMPCAVELRSINGKLLFIDDFMAERAKHIETVDLSGYAKGVYLIKISNAKQVINRKVIIR